MIKYELLLTLHASIHVSQGFNLPPEVFSVTRFFPLKSRHNNIKKAESETPQVQCLPLSV